MAQITGQVSGLQVESITDPEDKADDLDAIGQKLYDAFTAYQRGTFKASAAHAVDAINMIAQKHGITCGASL